MYQHASPKSVGLENFHVRMVANLITYAWWNKALRSPGECHMCMKEWINHMHAPVSLLLYLPPWNYIHVYFILPKKCSLLLCKNKWSCVKFEQLVIASRGFLDRYVYCMDCEQKYFMSADSAWNFVSWFFILIPRIVFIF